MKRVSWRLFPMLALMVSVSVFWSQPSLAEPEAAEKKENAEKGAEDISEAMPKIAKAAPLADPRLLVDDATQALAKRLLEVGGTEYEEDPAKFYDAVEETIAPYVAFKRIARRVMAKHFRKASAEQLDAFVEVFRRSLLQSYAKTMASYNGQLLKLVPAQPGDLKDKKALVRMEIHSGGVVYPLVYAMYKTKRGQWKLENLIVNGVNLGLNFRNQFRDMMSKEKDIDRVIEQWAEFSSTAASRN